MGPIALFDKSFIQSLSIDESVWFDHFFMPVVCPIFYIETLADLAKDPKNRTAEDEVRIIASKFPEMHSNPCINHFELSFHNILGHKVPMDGRIPRPGGRHVKGGGRTGIVFDQSPEEDAFHRWQRQEFQEVERHYARSWRLALSSMNLAEAAKGMKVFATEALKCKTLDDAYKYASAMVKGKQTSFDTLRLAVNFFNIPQQFHSDIIERWEFRGKPSLDVFAPYAAHVLSVEFFFLLSIGANLISSDRVSNRTDIAYLFYLPFCMTFISSDRLHKKTVPYFLREDQSFVWGHDLKQDLQKLNEHYLALPELDRLNGIMKFAQHPPVSGECLVTKVWEKHLKPSAFKREPAQERNKEADKALIDEFNKFAKGKALSPDEIRSMSEDDFQAMTIKRLVRKKKGSWFQLPHDLPIPKDES